MYGNKIPMVSSSEDAQDSEFCLFFEEFTIRQNLIFATYLLNTHLLGTLEY